MPALIYLERRGAQDTPSVCPRSGPSLGHNLTLQLIFFIDFLEAQSKPEGSTKTVHISALWHVLGDGLNSIWPASRTKLAGVSLGDVWPCGALKGTSSGEEAHLVPFHKLTQWMTYSIVEAIQHTTDLRFTGMEDMTGLPEYRNGKYVKLSVINVPP